MFWAVSANAQDFRLNEIMVSNDLPTTTIFLSLTIGWRSSTRGDSVTSQGITFLMTQTT